MKNPKININGKEIEMKKLTVEDWVEMAEVYDTLEQGTSTNVEFMKLHSKMLELAFGLTYDDLKTMPAGEIVPIYVDITVALKDILVSHLNGDEKKIETSAIN